MNQVLVQPSSGNQLASPNNSFSVIQPSSGNQLASPNNFFSFLKQFNTISLYVGGLGFFIFLTGLILIFTTAAMKHNNIHNPDQKNRIEKKSEIKKNEKIAFIILMTGIILCFTVVVINISYKS